MPFLEPTDAKVCGYQGKSTLTADLNAYSQYALKSISNFIASEKHSSFTAAILMPLTISRIGSYKKYDFCPSIRMFLKLSLSSKILRTHCKYILELACAKNGSPSEKIV